MMHKLKLLFGFSLLLSTAGCTATVNQAAAEQVAQKGEDPSSQEAYLVTEVSAENGSYVEEGARPCRKAEDKPTGFESCWQCRQNLFHT